MRCISERTLSYLLILIWVRRVGNNYFFERYDVGCVMDLGLSSWRNGAHAGMRVDRLCEEGS